MGNFLIAPNKSVVGSKFHESGKVAHWWTKIPQKREFQRSAVNLPQGPLTGIHGRGHQFQARPVLNSLKTRPA